MLRPISIICSSFLLVSQAVRVDAAEVNVSSALAMSPALKALAGEFERTSGHKLVLNFGTAGQVKNRVEAGENVDLVITAAGAIEELIKSGKVAAGSRVDIAKVGIGVAVRSGAAKPDISTAEAFKRTLLEAKSVGRGDPAAGGAAGTHVARVLERLGIDAEVKAKSKLAIGPAIAELAAKGEVEIAITQISEIVPVPGVDLVGPLPSELQNTTVFAAGVGANAKEPAAARELVKFLTGPGATEVRKTGMEPG